VSIIPTEKRSLLARWKGALARATPIGIGSAAAGSLQIVPPIIIAAMAGEAGEKEVGIFGAAFRLVLALTVVDRLFIALFLPLITRTRSTAPEEFPLLLRRIVRPLMIGSALLCAGISLLAGPIIDLVYDPEYAPAAAPLAVMSWFLFGTIMTSFFTYALIAVDVERAYLRASLISAVIAVALVLLLTWRFGTLGAAIGLTVGELLTTVLVWREYRKRMGGSTESAPSPTHATPSGK
jgi:O-antigen/teichoic acid export membrane protein